MARFDRWRGPAPQIQPLVLPGRPALPRAGTLAAVIGLSGAALLLTLTPREESGRTVKVAIAADGAATVQHLAGRQYLKVYRDIAGVPTACDGITGQGIRLGQRYTEAECAGFLEHELVAHTAAMRACTPGLTPDQHSYPLVAAGLLAFNIGSAGYCRSTVARRFNAGHIAGACDAFLAWNKARVNGVLRPVLGLTRRRQREREICLTGQPGYPAATLAARLERRW